MASPPKDASPKSAAAKPAPKAKTVAAPKDAGETQQNEQQQKGDTDTKSDLPIRVLFLRSLESGDDRKVKLLVEAFGSASVSSPSLGAKRTFAFFGVCFALTAGLLLILAGLSFARLSIVSGLLSVSVLLLMSLLGFFLAWKSVAQLVLRQAVLKAENIFKKVKPNVIVAPSYGALVALQMDVPKIPLVLLSPAQDVYYRYMHLRPLISISDYPYCIIVSGSKDSQVPLDDAIRLVETAEVGRCRLEVLEDDHQFASLKSEDFKNWVEEAFQRGAEVVKSEAAKGKKHFDASLFEPQETEQDKETV